MSAILQSNRHPEKIKIRIMNMQEMDGDASLTRLDLNLLRVLDVLLQTRSVTRAGERLGLSQPATSRQVARLRQSLGDPLLVRAAKGYVPTPRAEALAPLARTALDAARAVFERTGFDPASSTRTFRIATTDYGLLAVAGPASLQIGKAAPALQLVFEPWSDATLADMAQGHVDLALYADDPLPPDFHARELFTERYAALLRADHPLTQLRPLPAGRKLIEHLASYPQIAASYPSARQHLPDDVLKRMGAPVHRIALQVPYFTSAAALIGDSDRIMVLPRRAAMHLSLSGALAVMTLPATAPTFSYRQIWHARVHRDPGVTWLRQSLMDATRQRAP